MSKHLATQSVYIFPFSKPRVNSPLDNVFYEQNTTNMIRQLSNAFFRTDSFVIADNGSWIEFNIHGYYFKVEKEELRNLMTSLTDVVAYIIVTNATSSIPEYLDGQDDQGSFTGLHFTNTVVPIPSADKTVYALKLYDANGNLQLMDTQITAIDAKHS